MMDVFSTLVLCSSTFGYLCGNHAHYKNGFCACDTGFVPVKLGNHKNIIPCKHTSANESTHQFILFGTVGTSTHCTCIGKNVLKEHRPKLTIPVSYKVWGNRRKFNSKIAAQEGAWKQSNGGLNDDDRKILAQTYFESDSVFETGVGESTIICAFTRVPRYTGVDNDNKKNSFPLPPSLGRYRTNCSMEYPKR